MQIESISSSERESSWLKLKKDHLAHPCMKFQLSADPNPAGSSKMEQMRRRAIHLASLLLLLASLGVAESSTLRDGDLSLGAHYISVLLAQQEAAHSLRADRNPGHINELALDLPAAALAGYRSVWTVRPPAAHSLLQHAVSGSSL
jgi:hypothetical protein